MEVEERMALKRAPRFHTKVLPCGGIRDISRTNRDTRGA
jgi:hypothetical protein